jgi:type II secretory pathway pseudopilin PulG
MWRAANDNSYMQLRGQGQSSGRSGDDRGYAMAALLVAMSVMAVLMGAALPVWNKQAQREREEEYLFRAHEYARGVMKFQHKYGAAFPPSLDVLVEQRFVRRKYKDPLTGQDFQPVYQTAGPLGQPGVGTAGGTLQPGQIAQERQMTQGTPSSGFGTTATLGQTGGTSTSNQGPAQPGAPVIGVVSKSKATSIKIYNGRTRYDQWAVTYQDVRPGKGLPPDILQAINAAGAAGAQGGAGGFGQPGGQPGANPFGRPGGQPGANPFGQPGGQPGVNPFGQPGTNPFGQPGGSPGANPFGGQGGQPGANPFQPSSAGPGVSPFSPAYPPPPGQAVSPFGAPPRKR